MQVQPYLFFEGRCDEAIAFYKKAIGAVGHSILVAAWHILRDGVDYRELGGQYFDRVQREHLIQYYQRRLANLGVSVMLVEATIAP